MDKELKQDLKSQTIRGQEIINILKSFGELAWLTYTPATKEYGIHQDKTEESHYTCYRWKDPNPQLDKLIIEAVESFEGQIEWRIHSRQRTHSSGGINWTIEPLKKEPEIGIKSSQDLPKLAEHIKKYVEENRQYNG